MGVVYQHRRMDTNDIFYIGIGRNNKRAHDKSKRSEQWKDILNECKNYEVEILHEDLSYDKCKEIEKELIKKFGRKDLGTGTLCNLTDGGQGSLGVIFSEVSINKMSSSAKNRDEERIKEISQYRKGKKHSELSIKKIRESRVGKKLSDETKRKLSESHTGKKLSEEHIRRSVEGRKKNKLNL
jgi:hypothetical protein